jgi:PAS domain S-box-containing protein
MSVFVFSTLVLSLIFMLVIGTWWDGNASFKFYLVALTVISTTMVSGLLMVALYPALSARTARFRKDTSYGNAYWGRDVSRNLSTPAAVLDGYTVAFANQAFLNEIGLLGMSDQIIGMPFTNLVHPADHQQLARLIASSSQDNAKKSTLNLRLLHSDGTVLPVQVSLSPLLEDGNANRNLLQFSSDAVAEQPRKHIDGQFNYQLLVDQIQQIVFQVNASRELVFVNSSWERLLDRPADECLRLPLLQFIHPEDRPLVETQLNLLTQGKRPTCQLETRLIAKNGDSHWVELRAKNTSAHKSERSSVIGTFTDIRRMKSIESGLRANRRSLNTLISNIPGMLYRCKNDKNWTFEFVSDGCVDVIGYEPYEVVDNPNFSYTATIHPDDRPHTWERVQQQISKQEKFQIVYRIVCRSGMVKWVWEQGKGVYSSAGELLALEGFITDITPEVNPDEILRLLPQTQLD